MKRKPAGAQPLVYCPLVPNWGDEFDLRLYFACIHPGHYEFRSEGDRVLATQLLAAVAAYAVIPLTEEPEARARLAPCGAKAHLDPGRKSTSGSRRTKPFLVIIESSCTGPDWDDEFALTTYFARWSPVNYKLGARLNFRLAQEIYESAMNEFAGWVTLYRTALHAAIQFDGAMEGVVRCAMNVVELGRGRYLEWFCACQPEFHGLSPQQRFRKKGLSELERLLGGSA
jgi:hypothetical protein